jgi:catechol 2,3-dioxygenase-like lactoylglutathione lyase family enzyme
MIRGIHHVALNTANLERMLAFYRDVAGFEVVAELGWKDSPQIDEVVGLRGSAARQVMLRAGNAYLELFEYSAPAPRDAPPLRPCDRGYTHLCLDVVDIESEHARLTRAGARFEREPGDFGEIRAVYGKDPDGNVIEIQEILKEGHAFAFPPRAKPSA